jgi:MOSC domain-containing protein YiiM
MSTPRVVSVNLGRARRVARRPEVVSAIDKVPVHGPVAVLSGSLQGDEVANTTYHGGTPRALSAHGQEDLDWWAAQLGRPLRPGLFGENLTTRGLDLNACVLGEQWLVGTARLQVTSTRTGCSTFDRWMAVQGFDGVDESTWGARFDARGRPGVFLSVLDEGWVQEDDPVEVTDRPTHGVTAGVMFRALATEPALLPLLLEVEGLPLRVYDKAQRYLRSRT